MCSPSYRLPQGSSVRLHSIFVVSKAQPAEASKSRGNLWPLTYYCMHRPVSAHVILAWVTRRAAKLNVADSVPSGCILTPKCEGHKCAQILVHVEGPQVVEICREFLTVACHNSIVVFALKASLSYYCAELGLLFCEDRCLQCLQCIAISPTK